MGKDVEYLIALLVRNYLLLWNPNVRHPFYICPLSSPSTHRQTCTEAHISDETG